MPPGGGENARLPSVRYNLHSVKLAKVGDAPDLRQASAAANVRLHDGDLPGLDPLTNPPACCGELRTEDTDRTNLGEAGVTMEVVMLQGRFCEEDVAILNPAQHP